MALDNHEPVPRKEMYGTMERYVHPVTGNAGIRFTGEAAQLFMKGKSIILVDDGKTVEPHFSAGGNADKGYILFQPFPTTTSNPTRSDDGRPIDWSYWRVGPSKAYHLKVRPVEYAHWHASVSENGRNTDRTKCVTGEIVESLRVAKHWLLDEMQIDRSAYINREDSEPILTRLGRARLEIVEFTERSEGINAEVTIPWNDREITYGYRIMAIEGDCEETLS
jgi:hypothetical protein